MRARTRHLASCTRSTRLLATLVALPVSLALSATLLAGGTAAVAAEEVQEDGTSSGSVEVLPEIRITHANLAVSLEAEDFQADTRTVLADKPDFVTYNEVQGRYDTFLAPAGYALHRSRKNRYTMATPVAWRTDRWQLLEAGTHWISDWRGVPPGKKVELGRRAANWVTLQGTDGRTLSVVSAHVAPKTKGMPDLLRSSVQRLTVLVDRLAARGPVLVGGDFNVHHGSGRYPRDLLDAAGLVPTYDSLGTRFPTGDHFGNTIDYVFVRDAAVTAAVQHRPVELRSDHDAVVADLGWTVDAPATVSVVRSDPGADAVEVRRAAVTRFREALAAAGAGQKVQLYTRQLALRAVRRSLTAADERGVVVEVVLPGTAPAPRGSDAWVRRCTSPCGGEEAGPLPTLLLVSDVDGAPLVRLESWRALTTTMLEKATRVTTRDGRFALGEAEQLFLAMR